MIWKIWKKSRLNSEMIWNIRFSSIFSISFHNFLLYFPYHFTIHLAFLPYFPYQFTVQLIFLPYFPNHSEKIWKIQKKIVKR
jgi:hypothetical protein